ncbi:retrovirus-related pol polyprotein from transposon TNT 1-94 [Tanacetum coccineum]
MGNSNVTPYEQYLSDNDIFGVPSCASSALNSVCVLSVNDVFLLHDPIATELEIYKEQVAIYEQRSSKRISKCVTIPDCEPKVLAPSRYPIDVKPIPPRLKKNREVHLHYIERLKENVETLHEIVEDAKVERPLDTSLASACRYTKHSQELLEYISMKALALPTRRPFRELLSRMALLNDEIALLLKLDNAVSIPIDQEAPSGSHSPSFSDHQSSSVHQGVAVEHSFKVNPFAADDLKPFVNVFAPDHNSKASSSGQLAIDALWCFYNSVLSKVEPKNFKSAVTEDCWFQAMQDEIHEFDRLDVWELVPPPECAMIIALKWIYKVKLDEYGDVLKNKARLVAKGYC